MSAAPHSTVEGSSSDPIVAPAIRLKGMVHAAPRSDDMDPDDVHSLMHGDAMHHAVASGHATRAEVNQTLLDPTAMGFVTRSGKYLTRREAASHVLATNQFRIKNPRDTQLQALKARLERQIAANHPETSLDSFDIDFMAKSFEFQTLTDERSPSNHTLKVLMTHKDSGKAVVARLNRQHDHPEGQWEVESVARPIVQQTESSRRARGGWVDPSNANTVGVAGIRALARHLKETHGVTRLTGMRISGSRRNARVVNQFVSVNIAKSRAQFQELEHVKEPDFHGLIVRVMHPEGKQGADLHLFRDTDHPEGHWHIMNVDPVDTTRSIEGHTHSRAFANRLGPSIIRQTARHLKNTYGITSVRGFRVSGSRFAGQPDDDTAIEQRDSHDVQVTLGKAIPTITEIMDESPFRNSDYRRVDLHIKHPESSRTARMELVHEDGQWHLYNIGPTNRDGHISYSPTGNPHAGTFGVEAMRHVARHLRNTYGITSLSAMRVTGAKAKGVATMERHPPKITRELGKSLQAVVERLEKALFDMKTLSRNPVEVAQRDIERPSFEKPSSFAKYDETVGRTLRAWKTVSNQKRLDAGIRAQGHEWYHMDPLHRRFQERHGAQEGSRRFNLFMDTIAATSHNSEFGINMRRAGALFPFMLHGHSNRRLSQEEGLNHLLGPKLGNTAHRQMAAALQAVRDNKPTISKEPLKIDGFAENLRGNFRPLTADRHVGRQAGSPGETGLSIVYRGIEDATQHHAEQLAQRGHLPVVPGRSATAPFQSALWIGDALSGRVKSKPEPALAEFEREIHSSAQKRGIRPTQALDLFMDGHLHEFGGGAPGLREHMPTSKLTKSFADVYDRIEKGRVTPLFRITSTLPDASGNIPFRANPVRGATYFANTERGASEAAQSPDDDGRSIAATAISRRTHRIFGHNLPIRVPEARVKAQRDHFNRIAQQADPDVGEYVKVLAKHALDRPHTSYYDGRHKVHMRVYEDAHAPLHWSQFEDENHHYKPALRLMGYHGAAIADEAGDWNRVTPLSSGRRGRGFGSIALLPGVASKLKGQDLNRIPLNPVDATPGTTIRDRLKSFGFRSFLARRKLSRQTGRNISVADTIDMANNRPWFMEDSPPAKTEPMSPVFKSLTKSFADVYDRIEKGRVTPLFRVTTSPPDAQGKGAIRENPSRGVTYFANTQQGAANGSVIGDNRRHYLHMYQTAVTPDHRIYGHRLPRIISEERIAARKGHVERLASAAPHPVIGHTMRNLESRLWDRPHTAITLPNGKPGRQYYTREESASSLEKHAPLMWQELEYNNSLRHQPSKPSPEELKAAGPYRPTHAGRSLLAPISEALYVLGGRKAVHPSHLGPHASVVQESLRRLGYHGAAVADEAGEWGGSRSGKDRGSIALLPHAIGGKKLSAVSEPNTPEFEAIRELHRRREDNRRRALTKADVEDSFKRRSRGDALQPWKMVRRRTKHPLFDPIMIIRIPYGAMRDEYNAPTSTPGYAEAMADAAGDSDNA